MPGLDRGQGGRNSSFYGVTGITQAMAMRLYSPLQPLFDKSWRISEIEVVD